MKNYRVTKPGVYKVDLKMKKEGTSVDWVGVIDAREKGEYELVLELDHVVSKTKGRVLVKGVAENGARIKVSGKMKIGEEVKDADSFLKIKLLLLDGGSGAVAEPELEIMSGQVKAGHSAYICRLDQKQIDYLRSRGVKNEEAREMIIKGFLN